jgi:hypothetical protein
MGSRFNACEGLMQHNERKTYRESYTKKPNELARNILIDTATKACKAMGGAAQIGETNYWFVDADKFEIVRKEK